MAEKKIQSGYLAGYLQKREDIKPHLPLLLVVWTMDLLLVPLLFIQPVARLYLDLLLPPIVLLHAFAIWLWMHRERKELYTLFNGLYGFVAVYGIWVLEQKFNYYFIDVPFPHYSVVSLLWYAGGVYWIYRGHVRRAYTSKLYKEGRSFEAFPYRGIHLYIGAGMLAQLLMYQWVGNPGIELVLDMFWGVGFLMTDAAAEVFRYRLMRQHPEYVRFGRPWAKAESEPGEEGMPSVAKRLRFAYDPGAQRTVLVTVLLLLDLSWLPVVIWAPFTYFCFWLTVPALVVLHVLGIGLYMTAGRQRVGAKLFQGILGAVASAGYLILTMKLVYDLQGMRTLWYCYLAGGVYVLLWVWRWRGAETYRKYLYAAGLVVFGAHGVLGGGGCTDGLRERISS
ncbi:hypothetical protein [Tumebacillus flagellatus]|uniref:hypothetical protein n=1 Tax=Tumebacillus flagellatus TaxID=1157490 RepID=UPI001268E109|nr:hypothetical protein [Tumebacillus flagellatus]